MPGPEIALIVGSVRDGNFTKKAVNLVADELRRCEGVTVNVIDLADHVLQLPGRTLAESTAPHLQAAVRRATGLVVATPEYHGSYSSVIKLAIDNLGYPSGIGGKPVALLGVAAGVIGAIKALEHLRSVLSHVGGIVLPMPVSVARVNTVFDDAGNCLDPAVEKLVRGVATHLLDYIDSNICPKLALEALVRGDA
jgi:FMN reductase